MATQTNNRKAWGGGKVSEYGCLLVCFPYKRSAHPRPPQTLQTLPLCFSAPSSPNASYGPLRNVPARFGNVIKGVRDANGGQKGWHQADFTPGPRMARPKPGSSLRTADQKDCCTYADRSGKATKGMVKNANPQDKYILILLQYKLMLNQADGKRASHILSSTLVYLCCTSATLTLNLYKTCILQDLVKKLTWNASQNIPWLSTVIYNN